MGEARVMRRREEVGDLGGSGGRVRERSEREAGRWRLTSERDMVPGTSRYIEDREVGREQSYELLNAVRDWGRELE